MAEFTLSVVAPDRTIFEGEVLSAVVPGVNGYMGIMANHEPIIAALETGIVECKDSRGQSTHIAIGGGFMEVSGTKAIILANSGEAANEIDLSEAEKELEEARKALRGESSTVASEDAQDALKRAMNRIKAARRA